MYYRNIKLDAISHEIVRLMPHVRSFFETESNIEEYSRSMSTYQASAAHKKRQEYFHELIRNKIHRIFNTEYNLINVPEDLYSGIKGGVVDHHGILNNPVLIGVNIVSYYHRIFNRSLSGDFVTFATGNNPLGAYFHRRGFKMGGRNINLFGKKEKHLIVYGLPKREISIKKRLLDAKLWYKLSEQEQDFLEEIENLVTSLDYTDCSTLGDQFTKINFYLWKKLFHPSYSDQVPNLISLEYDDLVSDYLIYVLENDPNSFMSDLLLKPNFRQHAMKYFRGFVGSWNEESGTGTHWFWYRNSSNEREPLKISGNRLVNSDLSFAVELHKSAISESLSKRVIYPNMLLKFSLLIFYMGMKPFAGYGSANYLKIMQDQVCDFISREYPDESNLAKAIPVNNLTSVPVLLRQTDEKKIESYYAFDIMKDGGLSQKYLVEINKFPIKYFMAPNLNEMYDYAFAKYGTGTKKNLEISPEDYNDLFNFLFE